MIDLTIVAGAIDLLGGTKVKLRRGASQSRVNGVYDDSVVFATLPDIEGAFYDMTPDALKQLKDGEHMENMRQFWTRTPLQGPKGKAQGSYSGADQIVSGPVASPEFWVVIKINARIEGGYHKAIVGLLQTRHSDL